MRERPRSLEARNPRDRRVRSDVEKDLIACEDARPTIVEPHLERLRPDETSRTHDQFGAALLIVLEVCGNLSGDHVTLALAYCRHVNLDGARHRAKLRRMVHQMGNPSAPNLVLAGHARDIGTRASYPSALDNE